MNIRRFTPAQRGFHLLLMTTFLLQATTGMARLYMETDFGAALGQVFGGYDGCLKVHKAGGIAMLALFALHMAYVLAVARRKTVGPDSLMPCARDFKQFVAHVGWMLGICAHPRMERWSYWEKFDYWAVFWGMVVLGGSGVMLLDPVVTSRFIEGWWLNVARWVHRIEALLAMGHVFIIHFYVAHMRPTNFPMDYAMFSGNISYAHAQRERGAWLDRLTAEGQLAALTVPDIPRPTRLAALAIGYAAVAVGVYLLISGMVNALRVTW